MPETAKERPLVLYPHEVRATLDGRQTMLRRVVKPQPEARYIAGWGVGRSGYPDEWTGSIESPNEDTFRAWSTKARSPYAVGDRLWVRESFRFTEDIDGREVVEFRCGGTRLVARNRDGIPSAVRGEHRCTSILPSWKPSIHMPLWASRLTLEIASVRVERVQDISDADAEAEGVGGMRDMRFAVALGNLHSPGHRLNFIDLWDTIHGKGAFERNDWVWVIGFKRVEATP